MALRIWWKEAAASGKPIIWDVLDVWMQPRDNGLPEAAHLARIAQIKKECGASLLIGATEAMATAIGGVYLPHHSRIGLVPTPPRPVAEVVAYEGSERYLGSWRGAIERACARLGLRFVINPPDLAQADILVAFRGEDWDGWACRHWKSGVKYINAIAAGRPILSQVCAGYTEIRPAGLMLLNQAELVDGLQAMTSVELRRMAYEHGQIRARECTIDAVASRYWLLFRSALRHVA